MGDTTRGVSTKSTLSSGDKKQRNGFEVGMAWVDEANLHKNEGALFAPEDAVTLDEALTAINRKARQGEEKDHG